MNSRSFIILAVLIAAISGVAIWFLQTSPAPPVAPAVLATPGPVPGPSDIPNAPAPVADKPAATPAPNPKAALAAEPIPEWENRIDSILRLNPDNSESANTTTAQMLLNLLPSLPPEGQTEAAQHVANLLADKDYSRVLPILRNPSMPEGVLDVLVTDLMNRDDSVKLPALLEIAKIPNHPHREEAATDLQIFLDGDFGTDWGKWDAALKTYLKKQAAENATAEGAAPGEPKK